MSDPQQSLSRSGAFDAGVDKRVEKFTESIEVDRVMFRQDITGSIAHALMLADQQILTSDECEQITATLKTIENELESGEFVLRPELEDIHMNIEQALIDRIGDVGRKLHTGRSRNDQVSTDFRLWIREAIDQLDEQLKTLQQAFLSRCEADFEVILPAYTHLRRAQPVLAPHYWLAYCEKFARDRERLVDCRKRVNRSGLGAAALAGTTMPIDRQNTARRLGFESVEANSLDISSDRDFVLETAFCMSVIGVHLSGWAEEWILWSTTEFGFLDLPHQFCTGSSIMPQKINPDVLELIRGRSSRVIGELQTLLVLTKGLPLAYNRDLQEDKPALMNSIRMIQDCLGLAAPLVAEAKLNRAGIAEKLEEGFLDATTLMEYFIKRGVSQRNSHHFVGQLVHKATQAGKRLSELDIKDFQSLDPSVDNSVYSVLGVEGAISAFQSYGSTGPDEVKSQMKRWKAKLDG